MHTTTGIYLDSFVTDLKTVFVFISVALMIQGCAECTVLEGKSTVRQYEI